MIVILMTITERDLKILWGLAAGRCSKPGCDEECIKFLDSNSPTIVGEMAHIIAEKPNGPRGVHGGGDDTYENLILLCPTHHTEVDKATSDVFPVKVLLQWKIEHEKEIQDSFQVAQFKTLKQLARAVKQLLIENKISWQQYGPDSNEARENPLSNLSKIWSLRKLDTIIPNNLKIINMIRRNKDLFTLSEYNFCSLFIEHAIGFEKNTYQRTEGVPRFPVEFERIIDHYAGN